MTDTTDEFAWLDARPAVHSGLEKRGQVMRPKNQLGKDRVWFCDGEYIWFRRGKANPALLERHNRFVGKGDYVHVETQDDVEIWELQDQSVFKAARPVGKVLDITEMNLYDLRRQAALAACRYDWEAFLDIVGYLRQKILAMYRSPEGNTMLADNIYAEQYVALMEAINQRNGPTPGHINQQLYQLKLKRGEIGKDGGVQRKIISIGGGSAA